MTYLKKPPKCKIDVLGEKSNFLEIYIFQIVSLNKNTYLKCAIKAFYSYK